MHDNGVRWHDLDGDGKLDQFCYPTRLADGLTNIGRADFLCVESDGRTTAWLNKGLNNMVSYGQVKFSEGKERKSKLPVFKWKLRLSTSDIRFADIDGDGFDDYIFLDMITGRAEAWKNTGIVANGGTSGE